jgi:hypothetical protein
LEGFVVTDPMSPAEFRFAALAVFVLAHVFGVML